MIANLNAEQAGALASILPDHPGRLTIEGGREHDQPGPSRVFTFADGVRVSVDVFGRQQILNAAEVVVHHDR